MERNLAGRLSSDCVSLGSQCITPQPHFPTTPFREPSLHLLGFLLTFCHSSNHLSRTLWIINIRLKYFPNSDRQLSFLTTNSCISFLISSLSKMALCTWHNATLFRRIWPQVDRVNDFNLRRYCSLLKHETLFFTMTYLLMYQPDSKFQCIQYR